jgi:hypothetical protein
MRDISPRLAALAVVVAAVSLGACSNDTAAPVTITGHATPVVTDGKSARPCLLLTRCGIDEARIGGRYFEACTRSAPGRAIRLPGGETRSSQAPSRFCHQPKPCSRTMQVTTCCSGSAPEPQLSNTYATERRRRQ